ncbi:MAG: type III-B CRISPR-associated protein Cas10/Cmr2, partial [Streptomycetales bacterium]
MLPSSGRVEGDLVVVALGGVQRFIAESRTTADLAAGSEIVVALACAVADTCEREANLVFPGPGFSGGRTAAPNRVVSVAPVGKGVQVAEAAAAAARLTWSGFLRETYSPDPVPADEFVAGMPEVTWV